MCTRSWPSCSGSEVSTSKPGHAIVLICCREGILLNSQKSDYGNRRQHRSARPALAEDVLGDKKAYRDAFGAARNELINNELQRLIEAGYVVKGDSDVELTLAGKDLYKKMTTICKKSE
ncbi:MAG: hypothetical protein ACXWET_03920 [Halobacteriota archaeon]